MRIIGLLVSLLIIGYLWMTYMPSSSTGSEQVKSQPKEIIDRTEQQINQTMNDYQKKLKKRTSEE